MVLLRSLLFNIGFYGFTTLISLAALPLLAAPPGGMRWAMRVWARGSVAMLRFICGVRIVVEGREHLPTGGPALIAPRHESAFDTLIWITLVPDNVYVLKRELVRIPVFGWNARHAGMISVDRKAGAKAMRGLLRDAKEATAAGRQIVIFPEGTRVPPGETVPLQPGILALARATGLPVIPVATNSGRVWGKRAFLKRPGTIILRLLPPLPAQDLLPRLAACLQAEQARL
ncbi:lysophospholipid acyltransferase family protein [Roseococcus suduntuyensis]|uniref:1-acyl-sn-glycerol-3-phosphate acyltransferase n=1 Tax=Roseococcus suduntuyensis TaxID=455361 RepID=A0A840ADZ7_9PROT|nr:lysophospholipid acyltransferase family protein [Roseococcus suduntuyensis]MBB3898713.1 1-acyl-sn-glycerol-3-phosphate acyltransferase [Roseococcus suduntuyensis]